MEYIKLFIGILLLIGFSWLLIRNFNRKGIINALFRIDIIGRIIAGFYLFITSVAALIG